MPTSIDHVYINGILDSGSFGGLKAQASAKRTPSGTIIGDVLATAANNEIAIAISGGRYSALQDVSGLESSNADIHAGAKIC